MKAKLAELLLRRKELNEKVAQVKAVKTANIYEVKTTRKQAHEGIDDVIAQVPKLKLSEVTAEFDWYAHQLRLVDAAIQQANWSTEVEVADSVMQNFIPREDK